MSRYPLAVEHLCNNARRLSVRLNGVQADALDGMPQQIRLYPGGLAAASQVIELLRDRLQGWVKDYPLLDGANWSEQFLQQKVETALELLDSAVDVLPHPPSWFRLLPSPANRLAYLAFATLYQRRELARLTILRQQAIHTVEVKYAILVGKEIRQQIHNICHELLKAIDQASERVQILQAAMQGACLRLEKRIGYPGRVETLFRQPAVNRNVYEWAFVQGHKPADEMRLLLLEQEGLLDDWKALDARKIEAAIMSFGRGLYQFVWHLTLDEILAQRNDSELSSLWASLSQSAVPLLRPDFDSVGMKEGGHTVQTQIFLCQSARNTPFLPFLHSPLSRWQVFSTGDPYLACCIRLRYGIPFLALDNLYKRAQSVFEKMEPGARERFSLFDGKAGITS